MESSSTRRKAISKVVLFGIVPCILGAGIGQYLRWSGTIWLTDAGGFWPVVSLGVAIAAFIKIVITPVRDRSLHVWGWLVITSTWFYFPFWLAAVELPQSSAVVGKDGRVFIASDAARQPSSKVFLLGG